MFHQFGQQKYVIWRFLNWGVYTPKSSIFLWEFPWNKTSHPACPIFSPWILSGKLTSLWKITMFNGKTHYKWQFSIAMLGNGWVAGGCWDDDIISDLVGSFPKVPCVKRTSKIDSSPQAPSWGTKSPWSRKSIQQSWARARGYPVDSSGIPGYPAWFLQKTIDFNPPCYQWVNPLFRLGHVQ